MGKAEESTSIVKRRKSIIGIVKLISSKVTIKQGTYEVWHDLSVHIVIHGSTSWL